jgi:ABC-2 type transport system permease protein
MITAFLRFEIRRVLRSRRYFIIAVIIPVAVYLLVTSSVTSHGGVEINQTPFSVYYMISMATFGAILASFSSAAIRLADERTSGWLRSIRVMPLSNPAYLIGKLGVGMIMALPTILLVFLIAEIRYSPSLAWWQWLAALSVTWIGVLPFAAFGIFAGLTWTSDTLGPLVGGGMSLLAFFGGLYTPINTLGSTLHHVAQVMPTYHLASLGWAIVGDRPPTIIHPLILLGYLALTSGLAIWAFRREQRTSVR